MATRWAVATGNWSNPAIWNGGTLPTSSDDVYSNTFTVTIDQSVTVLSLRNTATTGVTLGGGFTVSGSYEIAASSTGLVSTTTGTLLQVSNTSGTLVLITATLANNGGGTTIGVNSSGTVNIVGNVSAPIGYNPIYIGGTNNCTINITGNLTGGGSRFSACMTIDNTLAVVNVVGNVSGGNPGNPSGDSHGIRQQTTGILNITGTVSGGNVVNTPGSTFAILSSSNSVTVTGNVFGFQFSNGSPAISGGSATINGTLYSGGTATAVNCNGVFSGPFISNGNGLVPWSLNNTFRVPNTPPLNNYFSLRNTSLAETIAYSGDTLGSPPSASNVRFGTTYAYGSLTGTLRMPIAQQVAFGVPVDATTGTAYFTVADFWNYLLSNGFTAGSIGDRLKNVATVDTTGSQLAAGN